MTNINIPSQTELSGIHIIYRGSASAETPDRRGVSHLLEHLICNRMQDLKTRSQKDAVTINAGTSDRFIRFYMIGLDEYVEKYREEFIRSVCGPITFTQEELEQERAVVLREIKQLDSDLINKSYTDFTKQVWNHWGPGGDPEVIQSITLAEVQDHYDLQYREPQMIITVNPRNQPTDEPIRREGYELPCLIDLRQRSTEPIAPLSDPNVYIAAGPVIPCEEQPYSQLICDMLCGELEKPLMRRLRKELQLCYHIGISQMEMDSEYCNVMELHAPQERFDEVTRETAAILEKGEFLTREEFDETIRRGKIQLRMSESSRYFNVFPWIRHSICSPGVIDTLTYEGLVEHYNKYWRQFLSSFTFSSPLSEEA